MTRHPLQPDQFYGIAIQLVCSWTTYHLDSWQSIRLAALPAHLTFYRSIQLPIESSISMLNSPWPLGRYSGSRQAHTSPGRHVYDSDQR